MYWFGSKSTVLRFMVGLFCGYSVSAIAAVPVNLRQQSESVLEAFYVAGEGFSEVSSLYDGHGVTHVRLQQMYKGYPVLGGDVILHKPNSLMKSMAKTSMNGVVYRGIEADLMNTPSVIFTAASAEKALLFAVKYDRKKSKETFSVQQAAAKLKVYMDENQKAHWVYVTEFFVKPAVGLPRKPRLIVDAFSHDIYQEWDDIKTLDASIGSGLGGNKKTGRVIYDGKDGNLPLLAIQRLGPHQNCFLQNEFVTVRDDRTRGGVVGFYCPSQYKFQTGVYWDGALDAVNGAYSPANDALYVGGRLRTMYQTWYGMPVLRQPDGRPMMINLLVHEASENAYWDGDAVILGDGGSQFYPLVSLGVVAHELSHGFTAQHANLAYYGQSGALNESFSDMAAKAAEYFDSGHNTWGIGADIVKQEGAALRYMDEPTKDCAFGRQPGNGCSISHVKDYKSTLDVHFASGIYNKVFYLLSNTPNWNTKKAFDVMVQANMHYWTSSETFLSAACGVLDAAKAVHYDAASLFSVFEQVGIKLSEC